MQLNAEQQKCVDAIDGVYVTIASPGSGKTFSLVQRHIKLLSLGVHTEDILNLTFTSAAALEMSRRTGFLDSEKIFRTFHSFCIEVLKKERAHLPFKLCDTVIPVATEDYKLLSDLVRQFPAIKNFRTLRDKISEWKCQDVSPDQALEETRHLGINYFFALAYSEYERKSREQGWLDFDNCIKETVRLFEMNQDVRNRWKRKYIAVDEFQDTDKTQMRLLQLIFAGNIFCVGDINQNLYAWRGSQTDNLTKFSQTFASAETLYLGENFRSTKRLVDFFRDILPEDNGIGSVMRTENEEGVDPVITEYTDDIQEAHAILGRIHDPINTAIIARTNRQLFIFQRLCVNRGIKYKILGKKDFFDQNEIKRLIKFAKETHDSKPAHIVLRDLITRHNMLELYKNASDNPDNDPIENLNNFVKMSANKGTVPQFLEYLRKLTHARKSAKGLALSTAHQSKGLEFKHVYVIGVSQGKLPHKDAPVNEESRVWFVSCSRAAETLNISFYGARSEFLNKYVDKIQKYLPVLEAENGVSLS